MGGNRGATTGLQLVLKTGGLDLAVSAARPREADLGNYRGSLAPFGIPSEDLDAAEIRRRWPAWRIGDEVVGLYQPDGGILDIRRANAAARSRWPGAAGLSSGRTRRCRGSPRGRTGSPSPPTTALWRPTMSVLAAWRHWLLLALLGDLGLNWRITLSQEQVSYFATPNVRDFTPDRFPMWIWHGEHLFYGFPVYGEVAVKAARDMTGRFVTQETRSSEPDRRETELIAAFLRERLPGAVGPELLSKTCVYDDAARP